MRCNGSRLSRFCARPGRQSITAPVTPRPPRIAAPPTPERSRRHTGPPPTRRPPRPRTARARMRAAVGNYGDGVDGAPTGISVRRVPRWRSSKIRHQRSAVHPITVIVIPHAMAQLASVTNPLSYLAPSADLFFSHEAAGRSRSCLSLDSALQPRRRKCRSSHNVW